MSILDAFKRIPRNIIDAQYETSPIIYEYPTQDRPSMPYEGRVTPDGPTYDMDFGGGQERVPDENAVPIGSQKTGRRTGFGKFTQALPGMIAGGIAGAATPNIAHGGATDIFRATAAGLGTGEGIVHQREAKQRQDEIDRYMQMKREADIQDTIAQSRERDRKANMPYRDDGRYLNTGAHGVFDRQTGKYVDIPGTAKPAVADKFQQALIQKGAEPFQAGGFDVTPPSEAVPQQTETVTSPDPAKSGFFRVPGTNLQMESEASKYTREHPAKPPAMRVIQDAKGATVATLVQDDDGNWVPQEARLTTTGPRSIPKPAAGHPSIADKNRQREAEADRLQLEGPDRNAYILNGRIGTPKKPALDMGAQIDAALGGGAPPAAKPIGPPAAAKAKVLPPEIAAKLPVGKKSSVQAPDGTIQLWMKNVDGSVKRLR